MDEIDAQRLLNSWIKKYGQTLIAEARAKYLVQATDRSAWMIERFGPDHHELESMIHLTDGRRKAENEVALAQCLRGETVAPPQTFGGGGVLPGRG